MAREIFCAVTLWIVLAALALPVHAQSNPCADNPKNLRIILRSGDVITGGVQDAMVEVDGDQVPVQLSISCVPLASDATGEKGAGSRETRPRGDSPRTKEGVTGAEPAATSAPASSSPMRPLSSLVSGDSGVLMLIVAAALIPVVLIAIVTGIYLKFIRPRQQKKPYLEALESVRAGRYDDALQTLNEVEGKLTGKERRDARFFIAISNYRQNDFDDALHVLKALYKQDPSDFEAVYFLAYIYVKQKQYEQALPILEKLERAQQLDLYQTKKLMGMVKLYQGMKAFNEGRIDVAADLFERVRALGDYADQIPADMSNRHTLLGTKALFENEVEEARHHFEMLQSAAADGPSDEQESMKATAALGLTMVAWVSDQPDYDDIETRLCDAARLVSPDERLTRTWAPEEVETSLEDKLTAADAESEHKESEDDRQLVLRDIQFLRGINVLNRWSHMESKAGLKQSETLLNQVIERFACALTHDNEFSDILLIVGLLYYYLHRPGTEKRNEGIGYLEGARKLGVRVPEVLEILNNIERMRQANASAVDKYMQILDKYLEDETVRREIRLELVQRLSSYQRVRDYPIRRDLSEARQVEPTVAEVRDRCDMLRVRVDELLTTRGEDAALKGIRKLSTTVKEASQELFDKAQTIQQAEADLLAVTGNQLLKE